jgi:hypothetical protein
MDHGNSVATMPFSYKGVVKIWILFETGPHHKHPDDLNKLGTFADTIKFMVGIGNNIVYKIYIQYPGDTFVCPARYKHCVFTLHTVERTGGVYRAAGGGFVATVVAHLPVMMRWTKSQHSVEYGKRKGSEETIQIIYDSIKGFLHPVITARHILVTARLNSRDYGKSLSFLVILQYVAHSTADGLYEGHERFIPFEIHGK